MKKTLLVSAMIAMSMVMMFVSCKKDEIKGCNCDILDSDGSRYSAALTRDQMLAGYDANDCNTLSTLIKHESEAASVTCTSY